MPQFPSTSWTLIVAAGGRASDSAVHKALERLCEGYWVPLYGYARGRGYSPEDAADLTQGYLAKLIEKDYLKNVESDRGRFRSFLLASFTHYLHNERDRAHAARRGGSVMAISISAEVAEGAYAREPWDRATPERIFERQWAHALLEQALSRLRREYEQRGKTDLFDTLRTYLSGENREGQYALHAVELGITPGAVKVEVHRLRKRFQTAVREEIAETVFRTQDIDDELRFLIEALQ
jgi:RNA polymerase sigma-70 factor (ECF subfamily)